jgi:hypothetical protein
MKLLFPGPGGWSLKPTAFHPAMGLKTICGILLASALALTPGNAFAQRGAAGAHAGVARPGGGVRAPQAPVVRSSGAGVSHPTAASPVITRPIITRPTGVNPLAPFRTSVAPFRTPLTSSGIFFPSRPPRRFPISPIGPFVGTAGLFGLGFNPFFFPTCSPFWGLAYGCGMGILPPYYGVGYIPASVYPSAPVYPSDPVYSPPESSATLQYTPPVNQYPSLESLPGEDLTASSGGSAQLRNETLLYLKDGSVFAVASYTVSDGHLRYVTAYGEKNDIAVDLLDLRKTIEANAERGVAFTLTPPPAPAPGASSPAPLGPAPAPPGPITPPKP